MIAGLSVLLYVDREGILSLRVVRDDGEQVFTIDPDNDGFLGEVVADEVNEAIERLGFRRPRAWSTHEGAYAWCTCLGWIATLQETARLAYQCGVSDWPDGEEHQGITARYIGAEQVRVAAQNAGLVPEDPGPFAFGDCAPGVDEDGLPCLRELSARYDLDYQADAFAHPPTEPRKGKPLWDWMEAHPCETVESAVAVVDGCVVSGFEWWWSIRWECEGPHMARHDSSPPDMPCVPVRGFWGDE